MTPTPKNPDAERLARELLAEAAGISVFALETAAGAPHVLVSDALRAIARALEQPAQEGWVLVPVEPTEAMKAAGDYDKWNYDDAADIYRAMIAAAPTKERT